MAKDIYLFHEADKTEGHGASMYFINSGKIIVEKGGKEVDAKYEGTYFGELGLMFSDGRKACVKGGNKVCLPFDLSLSLL